MNSDSSLRLSCDSRTPQSKNVRVLKALPAPEGWILVKETNMEKRAPCEIWRSGVNKQVANLKQQLTFCKKVELQLEEQLELDVKKMLKQNRDMK